MQIKILNPVDSFLERSAISSRAVAGSSSVTILNTSNIAAYDFLIIRNVGDEEAELKQIQSVSAPSTLNLISTIARDHNVGTKIYTTPYNQIEISKKTSASATYAVLVTIDLQPDKLETIYEYNQGQLTDFYKLRFKNSYTGQYSDYSNDIAGFGFNRRTVKTIVDTVLRRLNDQDGSKHKRSEVVDDVSYAVEDIHNQMIQSSSEYLRVVLEVPTKQYQHEYPLPDNFRELVKLKYGRGSKVTPVGSDDLYASNNYELVDLHTIYIKDVPQPVDGSTNVPTNILANNAYDTDGSWVATMDAINVSTDLDTFKTGIGSVNFDVDVSLDSSNTAVITNSTFTSQDLSDYNDTGKIRLWVYLPEVTYITSITLKWGSSVSAYHSLVINKDYKNHAFHNGWNLLEFDWSSELVTEIGVSDDTAIDYLQLILSYTANQPDDTDFRINSIDIANTWDANYVYELTYLQQPVPISNENDSIFLPEGYQGVIVDYCVAQGVLREGERDTMGLQLLGKFSKKSSTLIAQSSKRTRKSIGFRPSGKVRTYGHRGWSNSRNIINSDGTNTPTQ